MNFAQIMKTLPPNVAKDLEQRLNVIPVSEFTSVDNLRETLELEVNDVMLTSVQDEPEAMRPMVELLLSQIPAAVIEVIR